MSKEEIKDFGTQWNEWADKMGAERGTWEDMLSIGDDMKLKQYKRNAGLVEFSDHLKKDQWCEITEWDNGEGFDVAFEDKTIQLTHAEFQNLCGLGNLMMGDIGEV
jgi:hypothetical protein